jgi:ParB/RepB/Spo0J family partition protein
MTAPSFENIAEGLFTQDEPEGDKLYRPAKMKEIARRYTFVLFDEITEDSPTQSRREVFNPEKYPEDQELVNSIRANGIVTPIVIRAIQGPGKKQGERKFALVAGHRRVAAGIAADLTGTEGVVSKPDEDEAIINLVENQGHRKLSSYEKALAYETFRVDRELSIRQVATLVGLAKSYTSEIFQALQSPPALINIWAEGDITPKALIILKDHWELLGQEEAAPLLKGLRGLSRTGASDLSAQLSAGTPLKKALSVIINTGQNNKPTSGKSSSKASAAGHDIAGMSKDELLTAMTEVFPRINEKKARVLYDYTVMNGIQDPEILWAAALYVDRGGQISRAVPLTATVMEKRSRKTILAQEVKLMKKVACAINTMKKEDKIIIDFMNIVFSSRR